MIDKFWEVVVVFVVEDFCKVYKNVEGDEFFKIKMVY